MTRSKALSALALAGAIGGLSAAQPPAAPEAKKAPPAAGQSKMLFRNVETTKASDPVAEAMKHHPDVRVAEAKMRVAEAELAQAKLLVAQRVTAAQAKVQIAQAVLANATRSFQRLDQLRKAGNVAQEDFDKAEKELTHARAALAAAEADLKASQGITPGQTSFLVSDLALTYLSIEPNSGKLALSATDAFSERVRLQVEFATPLPGSTADKLRELIDKPVSLDLKAAPFNKVAAEFLSKSGLDAVTVRYPEWASAEVMRTPPTAGPLTGTQTVSSWAQLLVDDFNRSLAAMSPLPPVYAGKYEVYVRDYGLLITKTELAPPGAVTLSEFARQVRVDKAEKEKAAKPKP